MLALASLQGFGCAACALPPAHFPLRLCRCLPLAPSNSVDPLPVGGNPTPRCRSTLAHFRMGAGPPGPDPATKCRVTRDHPPCRSSRSRCTPHGSSLFGKALACAPLLGCPLAKSFRCIRVMASAVFTAGTSFFGSARYRAGPLVHVRIRVTPARDWAGGPSHPSLRWAAARLPGGLDVDYSVS